MKVILLARKPLGEGTVANNVVTHGTGAINIDESRISTPGETVKTNSRSNIAGVSKGIYGDYKGHGTHQTRGQKLGRFPANLVLEHLPGCVPKGAQRVEGQVTTAYVDEDGSEVVEVWDCEPGCPVVGMEESGLNSSGVSRFYKQVQSKADE